MKILGPRKAQLQDEDESGEVLPWWQPMSESSKILQRPLQNYLFCKFCWSLIKHTQTQVQAFDNY